MLKNFHHNNKNKFSKFKEIHLIEFYIKENKKNWRWFV